MSRKQFIFKEYTKHESIAVVQKLYRARFRVGSIAKSTVWKIVKKFEETGMVCTSGQPAQKVRRKRSDEKISETKEIIEVTPTKSVRQVAAEVEVSPMTAQRILTCDLKLKPYKVTLVQRLKPDDAERRLTFCNWLLDKHRSDAGFLDSLFVSDESIFQLDGKVNTQNYRIWGEENPHVYNETKSFSPKITIWIAMSASTIIGPYVFRDEQGKPTTVNAKRYVEMLDQYFLPQLHQRHIQVQDTWFQQDLATPHTSGRASDFLQSKFGERLISRGLWPARSPDLAPPDFYLFGHLKHKVYKEQPSTLDELEIRIRHHLALISPHTCYAVFANLLRRVKACKRAKGAHFQHLAY